MKSPKDGKRYNTDGADVTATFKPLLFDRVQFIQKYIEPFITE